MLLHNTFHRSIHMGKPYSLDLRERAVKAHRPGLTQETVAEHFGISRRTLCGWLARMCGGGLAPKPRSKGTPYKIDAAKASRLIGERPGMTLQEMADRLGVTAQAVWHHWRRSNVTRKKKMRYRERDGEARAEFAEKIKDVPPQKIIYADESGIEHQCCREYGWSLRGEAIFGETSGGRPERTTLIAGLRAGQVVAPAALGGYTDGETFRHWVECCLAPEISPGDLVVIDNASIHKSRRVRELIEAAGGTLLFLPTYSPDMNPIEPYWSFVKGKVKMNVHRYKRFSSVLSFAFSLSYRAN